MDMETGKVKWYDDSLGYGFLVLPGGKEIYFRRSHGRQMQVNVNARTIEFASWPPLTRPPKEGDEVVFERQMRGIKPKAAPWSYVANYNWVLGLLANLIEPVTYRVLETTNYVGHEHGQPGVIWEGNDIEELLKKFPVSVYGRRVLADPLEPYYEDEKKIYEVSHWFERLVDGGWMKCPDPRPSFAINWRLEAMSR